MELMEIGNKGNIGEILYIKKLGNRMLCEGNKWNFKFIKIWNEEGKSNFAGIGNRRKEIMENGKLRENMKYR